MLEFLSQPWPWYVSGPLIGLFIPLLLWVGNRRFGVSSSFRHICSATLPSKLPYLNYNWRSESWNLIFVLGIVLGGVIGGFVLANPEPVQISAAAQAQMSAYGLGDYNSVVPSELISWENLFSLRGLVIVVIGGFLVGFGARYAGGCTSGHGITGLANMELPSLVAIIGFFIGGLFITYVVLPALLQSV